MLRLGGRGSHATLMSEGLGLDRESWGAVLGTETEACPLAKLASLAWVGETGWGAKGLGHMARRPEPKAGLSQGSPRLEQEAVSFPLGSC